MWNLNSVIYAETEQEVARLETGRHWKYRLQDTNEQL
jgi:hypothetical protein